MVLMEFHAQGREKEYQVPSFEGVVLQVYVGVKHENMLAVLEDLTDQ